MNLIYLSVRGSRRAGNPTGLHGDVGIVLEEQSYRAQAVRFRANVNQ